MTNPSLSEAVERLTAFLDQYSHVHGSSTLMSGLKLADLRTILQSLSVGEEKMGTALMIEIIKQDGFIADVRPLTRAVLDTMGMANG